MPVSSSTLDRGDLTSVPSCEWTQHFEQDLFLMQYSTAEESHSPLSRGIEHLEDDHYYWFGGDRRQSVDFDLPGYASARGLEVKVQDVYVQPGFPRPQPLFDIEVGENESVAIVFPELRIEREKGAVVFHFDETDLAGARLAERGNDFIIAQDAPWSGGYVDYFRWTYLRRTSALFDQLEFDTDGLTGIRQWDLSRFAGADIVLVEVTEPTSPSRLEVTAEQISGSGSNRTARIQLDLGASGQERVFVARRYSTLAQPQLVERTSGLDLGAPRGSDVVVIAHPDFLEGMQPWVDHRTAQGWDVELLSVRDVFDQFNGGRPWPTAIRNFLRYSFRTRSTPPSFVLLVGDASKDHAQVLTRRAPDYVPTQSVFSNAFSEQGTELIATDHYFVDDLVGIGNTFDFFPDASIGRLPVGNQNGEQAQLADLVDKIVRYDDFEESEAWRNRVLLCADDEFSSRVDFDEDYRFRGDSNRQWPRLSESIFRYGCREATRRARQAGYADMVIDSFYVSAYLDSVACLGRCVPLEDPPPPNCEDWSCAVNAGGQILDIVTSNLNGEYTAEYAQNVVNMPLLLRRKIDRGNLFLVFQSHANRGQAGHELMWVDSDLRSRFDSELTGNVGKPFVFFGFGCHMSEFAHQEENAFGRGDCLTERMLFQDQGRGAIAGLASSGYEWLPQNDKPLVPFFQCWFSEPPTGPDGRTRWLLGEMIDAGKLFAVGLYGGDTNVVGMIPTYVLLGDPTMTIDLAPPRADRVEVDGAPWTGEEPLRAPLGTDEVTIEVVFRDEVALEDVSVERAGTVLDPSEYDLLPDPDHPETDRRALVRYRPALDVPYEDYDIEIRADDAAGRRRSVTFPVRFDAQFEFFQAGEFVPWREGTVVELEDSVRVSFTSPVPVGPDAISVLSADVPLDLLELSPATPGAEADWSWTALAQITARNPESFDVAIELERRDSARARRAVTVSPASEQVSLLYSFNMPNPFAEETTFVYRLDGPVATVDVSVFTLGGKKIWEGQGPTFAGERYLSWDGRDEDGDPVANGVYFYKLLVRTLQGEEIARIDRIARVR